MTENELYWLVGLFEGEGWIHLRQDGTVTIGIAMTDEDVILRCRRLTGVGKISVQERPPYKVQYSWKVNRTVPIRALLTLMLPHFGQRRRQRALEALAALESVTPTLEHWDIPHGTERGYQKERWHKFSHCDACKDAHAAHMREYRLKGA